MATVPGTSRARLLASHADLREVIRHVEAVAREAMTGDRAAGGDELRACALGLHDRLLAEPADILRFPGWTAVLITLHQIANDHISSLRGLAVRILAMSQVVREELAPQAGRAE
jgi:hypothetical protein